jgi:hypothetical protein
VSTVKAVSADLLHLSEALERNTHVAKEGL